MKSILKITVVFALLSVMSLNAQMFGHRMPDGELKAKLKEYHKENVCPQWMIWKTKIDNSLSAEDLQKLNQLRADAQKTMAEKKECMENCMKNSLKPDENSEGNEKGKGKGFGKGMKHERSKCVESCRLSETKKEYGEKLKEILKNYDNLVKDILEQSKPFHEKWSAEKKAIIEEYMKNNTESSDKKMGRMHDRMGKFGSKHEKGKQFIGMLMLWNGSCDIEPGDYPNFGNSKPTSDNSVQVNVYPNPSSDRATIKFNLLESSKVKLTVSSTGGILISKLFEGSLNAGDHTYEFDAGTQTAGVYIYNLEVNGKVSTGKIVLNK